MLPETTFVANDRIGFNFLPPFNFQCSKSCICGLQAPITKRIGLLSIMAVLPIVCAIGTLERKSTIEGVGMI
jgi:hypothetical protein